MIKISKEFSRQLSGITKLSGGTILSRLTGMFREIVLASFLGTGPVMDAFIVAFTLPNLFRRILGEKVMESAMMPAYKKLRISHYQKRAQDIIKTSFVEVIGIAGLIVIIGIFFSSQLVHFFAPGFDAETHTLSVWMTNVMFPFLILIAIASFFGAILLAHEKFTSYSLAPLVFNVFNMLAVLWGYRIWGFQITAYGVVVGGLLECLVMYLFIPKELSFREGSVNFSDDEFKKINKRTLPIIIETFLEKTVILVDQRLASFLDSGSIAALGYASRLMQLPFGVFALAIARTFYPMFVDVSENIKELTRCVRRALQFVLVAMIPCSVFLILFRDLIIRIVYQHGVFDKQAASMTSIAFACYSIGIVGMSVLAILSRAFNALLDTKTPVYVTVGLTLSNVVFNLILVNTSLRHAGLALASSIAYTLAGIALYYLLKWKLKKLAGQPMNFRLRVTLLQVIAASLIGGLTAQFAISPLGPSPSIIRSVIFLAIGSISGILAYGVALNVMGMNLKALLQRKID